jgi:ABC-type multidrug transport system ATPase subunit
MLQLDNISKRFRYEWIFKNINYAFEQGNAYAILGPNGSGKSTLMKILSGHLTPSVGKVQFSNKGYALDNDTIYQNISYAAPYIDVIEEMSLTEIIDFYIKFKPLAKGLTINNLIDRLDFQKSKNKEIRFFSSGMKQRLKLALAVCSQSPILLLDEPTTNLDAQGVAWYQQLMADFSTPDRLIVVASNIEHDYVFCNHFLSILDYKN